MLVIYDDEPVGFLNRKFNSDFSDSITIPVTIPVAEFEPGPVNRIPGREAFLNSAFKCITLLRDVLHFQILMPDEGIRGHYPRFDTRDIRKYILINSLPEYVRTALTLDIAHIAIHRETQEQIMMATRVRVSIPCVKASIDEYEIIFDMPEFTPL